MAIDEQKIDEAVLALLYLTLHDGRRAWKGFDWDALNRLHEKGFIEDPVGKTKSVVLTDTGLAEAKRLPSQKSCIPSPSQLPLKPTFHVLKTVGVAGTWNHARIYDKVALRLCWGVTVQSVQGPGSRPHVFDFIQCCRLASLVTTFLLVVQPFREYSHPSTPSPKNCPMLGPINQARHDFEG